MTLLKGVGDFFGLDIGLTGVRVVQLSSSGQDKWVLRHFGQAPLDIKTASADSNEARNRLGTVITTLVGQSGIKTKNVVINIPASKSFVTIVDVQAANEQELNAAVKYQLDQFIPTAPSEAKVDWAPLGQSLHDPTMQEVLIASTSSAYAEERLDFVESLGFDVVAAEPEPLAMIRAVNTSNNQAAQAIVEMSEETINVGILFGGAPRLVRTIPYGLSNLSHAASQSLSVPEDQARQFILKFGMAQDKLEGKVVTSIESTLNGFLSEIAKTIKFFQNRYPSVVVGDMLLVGFASSIPMLDSYFSASLNISVSTANPWARIALPSNDPQFAAIAPDFAVAIGLAQRGNK